MLYICIYVCTYVYLLIYLWGLAGVVERSAEIDKMRVLYLVYVCVCMIYIGLTRGDGCNLYRYGAKVFTPTLCIINRLRLNVNVRRIPHCSREVLFESGFSVWMWTQHPWDSLWVIQQQARPLTPRRGTVAHLENQGMLCSRSHLESIDVDAIHVGLPEANSTG